MVIRDPCAFVWCKVYYFTLSNSTTGVASLVAVDIASGTIAPLPPSVHGAFGTDGPLCFDVTLGMLVAVGGSSSSGDGSIVGWTPPDGVGGEGTVTVLRAAGLGGLVGVRSLGCLRGVVAVGLVSWQEQDSPTRILAFDFGPDGNGTTSGGEPFHNSTAPQDLHDLVLTTA